MPRIGIYLIKKVTPNKDNITVNDGMDITIFVFDVNDEQAHFAGVKNPIYLVRDGKIQQYVTFTLCYWRRTAYRTKSI